MQYPVRSAHEMLGGHASPIHFNYGLIRFDFISLFLSCIKRKNTSESNPIVVKYKWRNHPTPSLVICPILDGLETAQFVGRRGGGFTNPPCYPEEFLTGFDGRKIISADDVP